MKSVSIIVPIYKVEKYLRQCLDSILDQSFGDLRIILVDDGSPDGCGKICDEYAVNDNRIIIIHGNNGGLSAARNRGLAVCEGKFVLFADSDDYLEKNAVDVLFNAAEQAQTDILLYDAISFDDEAKSADEAEINKYIRKYSYPSLCTGAEMFLQMQQNNEYRSPVQYCLYNKPFLDKHGLRFHEDILHEDQEFNFLALLYAQRAKHIPDVLYHHRFRSDSIMGKRFSKKNTGSWYEVINTAMSKSDDFLSSPQTARAFKTGLAWMIENFYIYIKRSADGESAETKAQIQTLRRSLKNAGYYGDAEIKNAALNRRKKNIIKSVKLKLYPRLSSLLRKKK